MPLDVYRLERPHCGWVEGDSATQVGDADVTVDADSLIEEQEFSSPAGPVPKCRCPQCGTWVSADRVEPT